jgi:hypothetical protein
VAVLALVIVVAAGVGVAVAVQRTPSLQRSDWRDASSRLGQATVARAVIVEPAYSGFVLNFYGQPLGRMLVGAKVREVDIVGGGFNINLPAPPGFVATERTRVPGIVVLRFRAAKPLVMTPALIKALGGTVFLELSPAGTRWIDVYVVALLTWRRALVSAGHDAHSRAVLAAASRDVKALAARIPAELPNARQLLSRLGHVASLAGQVASRPTVSTESALRQALAAASS